MNIVIFMLLTYMGLLSFVEGCVLDDISKTLSPGESNNSVDFFFYLLRVDQWMIM